MSFDAIVIGAGHNGLTAATVLAQSGRKVLALEASSEIGGGARTVEFHPGFKVSPVAHLVNRLHRKVISTLKLEKHGLELGALAPTVVLSGNGPVVLHGGWGERLDGVAGEDARKWTEMRAVLLGQAAFLQPFLARKASQLGKFSWRDKAFMAGRAIALRATGREKFEDFLRMLLICAADVAEEYPGDARLQALTAFDAVLGQRLGPRSPTSLLGLLYKLSGGVDGQPGGQVVPKGGMGAVAAAFAGSARANGVELRCDVRVAQIVVEDHRAVGVILADGSAVRARQVLSATAPQATLLGLVGAKHLDAGLVRSLSILPGKGNVAKLHLALDRVPEAAGMPGRFVIADSLNEVEQAFNPSKYGELPDRPVFEFVLDRSGAPEGASVISACIPFAPFDLKQGWDKGRDILTKSVLTRLEEHCPGIGKSVVHAELLAPPDLAARYGIPGGHWHHVDMSADRLLMLRPLHELAGYQSTIAGLTLCGAGTHPGGGICGISGLRAAQSVIAGDAA